jgi:hypothetical protein
MAKAVFDGSNRELALHMELRLKTPAGATDRSEPQARTSMKRREPPRIGACHNGVDGRDKPGHDVGSI